MSFPLEEASKEVDYIQASNIVIDIVSEILDEIVKENENTEINDNDEDHSTLIQDFFCKKQPQISINKYLKRFMKYSKPEPSTIIITLI